MQRKNKRLWSVSDEPYAVAPKKPTLSPLPLRLDQTSYFSLMPPALCHFAVDHLERANVQAVEKTRPKDKGLPYNPTAVRAWAARLERFRLRQDECNQRNEPLRRAIAG